MLEFQQEGKFMENFFSILSRCALFRDMTLEDIQAILPCLESKTRSISKGGPVFLEGEPARWVGVLLAGAAQVVQDDYYGNRSVLSILQPGDTFGEAFSCAGISAMPVSVMALTDCEILLLDCSRVMTTCSHSCHFHTRLIQNLLKGMALKNLAFTEKIRHMSKKTTREKLLSYLLQQAKKQGAAAFTIPYDRQGLADYLGVERSAMSAELGKLKKAGLLDTKGSWFCLKDARRDD